MFVFCVIYTYNVSGVYAPAVRASACARACTRACRLTPTARTPSRAPARSHARMLVHRAHATIYTYAPIRSPTPPSSPPYSLPSSPPPSPHRPISPSPPLHLGPRNNTRRYLEVTEEQTLVITNLDSLPQPPAHGTQSSAQPGHVDAAGTELRGPCMCVCVCVRACVCARVLCVLARARMREGVSFSMPA